MGNTNEKTIITIQLKRADVDFLNSLKEQTGISRTQLLVMALRLLKRTQSKLLNENVWNDKLYFQT